MNITNLTNKIKRMRKKLNDKLINNYTDKRLKPQDRILMSDRTYKNIEDLVNGDEIMGFNGEIHKITKGGC